MKARLINNIQVGKLNTIDDCGHNLPDGEVDILCGPFVSTIGNSPMLAWYLCETQDGRRYYIEATNLQKLESPLEDWTKDVGMIFSIPVDWAAFRREVAKDMLPITAQMKLAKGDTVLGIISKETAVKLAIEYADELIKQLKLLK